MTNRVMIDGFTAVDFRAGTIIAIAHLPEARKAARKFTIDLGPELGMKRSSAPNTELYALIRTRRPRTPNVTAG